MAAAVLLVTWLQDVETSLDPTYAPISFYARTPHGWMLLVALLMIAIATLFCSRAYALLNPSKKGALPIAWLSVSIVCAALLRAHQYFPWEGPPTVVGSLHLAAAVAGMLLFAYAALVIGHGLKSRTLLAMALAFVAISAFSAAHAGILLLVGEKPQSMGLEERLAFLVAIAWFFVLFPFFGKHKTSLGSGTNQA